ncbi:flagellar basal body-associated FliL family protein [Pseudidiomarina insulisalsae]|uniref:Flagellar protein FliL n=1 Tax=Pseudidiomarina insulisalsae TaxID=575789 RepID=A0A432YDP1_9GAMM|nr:flagellar basal body-associated FliL family protein [Pseudidiomarina insulisalsae]RUO59051.1 flagellar basal body-associated protein FliL [Pseudidiomarina insulisalsae]
MANKAVKNEPTTSNSQSPFLVVLLIAVIAMMAMNTWLIWDMRKIAERVAFQELGETIEKDESDPIFLSLSPFTVNLDSDQFGPRLLYAGLTLELPDEDARDLLTKNMPQVRNRLLVLLSGQPAERVSHQSGKEELAQVIAQELSQPYQGDVSVTINDVLFTEFIVQ